ncbi:hypothetical protein [Acidipropionibacterium acidipropionici]|uniref:DUF222 domain-containing protein n=1 Tax=Acidipropionibacterium acidipropionici TaxID=1748 RepID=A0AAC8YG25_9ACTN|nr:hypothetical protein [Acidipropionibacterium acidipropionici]AMS06031.1 hypothetical protein AXH35_11900 [Acidipropionibacterium acidipropionici]AOZ47494.1 hypothetical protein A8L58_13350 [Acidipropionibacterium acidipropionici]
MHQASQITADPDVRDAALAGTVSPGKAAAIGRVLRDLPWAEMTPEQNRAAADTLIGQAAGGATTRQIAGSTDKVLEQVAPNLAPSPEGRAAEAERQRRQAIRERHLTFTDTGTGSVRILGQVPQMEGDLLRSVVGACVERGRGDERRELEALKYQRATGDLSAGEYLAARTALQERERRTTAQRQADSDDEHRGSLLTLDARRKLLKARSASDQWRIDFDETGRPHVHPPRRMRGDLPPGHPDTRENSARTDPDQPQQTPLIA